MAFMSRIIKNICNQFKLQLNSFLTFLMLQTLNCLLNHLQYSQDQSSLNQIERFFYSYSNFNFSACPIFMNRPADQNSAFNLSRTFSTKDLTGFVQPSFAKNPTNYKQMKSSASRKDMLNEILQSINSFKNSQNLSPKDYHLSPRKSQHRLNLRKQDHNSFCLQNNDNITSCCLSRHKLLLNSNSNSILKTNQTNKIDKQYTIQQKTIQHSQSLKGLKQSQQSTLLYKKLYNKLVNKEMNNRNNIFEKKNHNNNNQKHNQKNINIVSSIQPAKNRLLGGKDSHDSLQAKKKTVEAIKQKFLKYGIHINQNLSKNQNKKLISPPTQFKNIKKQEQQGQKSFANSQIELQMMNSIQIQSQKKSQGNSPCPLTNLKEKDLKSYLKMQKIIKDKQKINSQDKQTLYSNKNKKYDLNDSYMTQKGLSPIKSIKSINSLTSKQTHVRNFNLNMQNFTYDFYNFGLYVGNDPIKQVLHGNQKKKLEDFQQFGLNLKQKLGSYGNKKLIQQLFLPINSFNTTSFNESFKKQLKQTIQTNCTQNLQLNKLSIKDFSLGKEIGKGKFGKVFLCAHIMTGFLSAIKIIKKQTVRKQRNLKQLIRQIKIQSYLSQSNNVKMYGYFDDQENIYLLVECCMQGQLYTLLKNRRRFQQDEAIPIIKDICEGLNHLHSNNIIHRDIKPENIVMSFKMAKLCDFGWSVNSHNQKRQTFCGTPLYVSPELLMGKKYDYKVDVWALGIMVYQLLTGKLPFHITNQKQLKKIVTTEVKYPQYLSENAKKFIQHLLQKNPSYRNGMQTIIKNNFLVQGMQRIRNKAKIL